MLIKLARLVLSSKLFSLGLTRNFSGKARVPKVCIIGSGPAGFYVAQHLIKVSSSIINVITLIFT